MAVASRRADTPPEIIEQVRKAATEVVASDAFHKKLNELGLDAGRANGAQPTQDLASIVANGR